MTIERLTYNYNQELDRDTITELMNQQGGRIQLPNRIRSLALTLDSKNKEINRYQFQLMGFDEEPYRSTCPCVRYTNLKGGNYTLVVSAFQNTHKLDSLQLPISIALSPFELWWIWLLLSVCTIMIPVLVIYFLLYDRSKRKIGIETVRNQIASDLHDYVSTHIAAISGITEGVNKQQITIPPAVLEALSKIKNYSREAIELLEATVWAINPANESIEELVGRMEDYAANALYSVSVDLNFCNCYNPKTPIALDMQQRFSMDGMFKEAIRNIVKHAEASKVDIELKNENNALTIKIQDNGKGFEGGSTFQGQGMKNFRRRAKENFFDLDIRTAPGQGTSIKIVAHSM